MNEKHYFSYLHIKTLQCCCDLLLVPQPRPFHESCRRESFVEMTIRLTEHSNTRMSNAYTQRVEICTSNSKSWSRAYKTFTRQEMTFPQRDLSRLDVSHGCSYKRSQSCCDRTLLRRKSLTSSPTTTKFFISTPEYAGLTSPRSSSLESAQHGCWCAAYGGEVTRCTTGTRSHFTYEQHHLERS